MKVFDAASSSRQAEVRLMRAKKHAFYEEKNQKYMQQMVKKKQARAVLLNLSGQ